MASLLLGVLMTATVEQSSAQVPEGFVYCEVGTLVDGRCVEEGDPPEPGPDVCPVSSDVIEEAGECFRLVVRVGGRDCPAGTTPEPTAMACRMPVELVEQIVDNGATCPDGFTESFTFDDVCVFAEPALQADVVCPRGARGDAGDCYTVSGELLECPEGALAGDVCVVEGPRPMNGPSTCPVGEFVFEEAGECLGYFAPRDGSCVFGVLDPDTELCIGPVTLRPGPLFCEAGFGLVNSRCIRYVAPVSGSGCPADATLDDFGLCRTPIDDRAPEPYCPTAGQELQGSDCVTIVPFSEHCSYNEAIVGCEAEPVCPERFSSPPVYGGWCVRYELAVTSGINVCPTGSRGSAGACYILVAKGPGESDSPVCPSGSVEDAAGDCRKPVADALPPFFCPQPNSALTGRICMFVTAAFDLSAGCPEGFDDVGVGCEAVEPAVFTDPACPVGATGPAGACIASLLRLPSIDFFCAEGVFTSSFVCQVADVPVTIVGICPTSATVREEGDECYVLVSPQADGCPVGTTPDPNGLDCRRPVDLRPVAGSCNPGFAVTFNRCLKFEPPVAETTRCAPGTTNEENGVCLRAVSDAQGDHYCEAPWATLQFEECIYTAPISNSCTTADALSGDCGQPVLLCPDGYSPDDSLGGLCARFEAASQRPPSCPAGSSGSPGDCFIRVAKVPQSGGTCAQGTLVGGNCLIEGDPPVTGPDRCPVSGSVRLVDGECFRLVFRSAGECPGGTTVDPGSEFCRQPIDLVPGITQCEPEFGLLDGACVRFEPADGAVLGCPDDSTEDAAGDCRKPVPDASGAYFCPDTEAALNGKSCVFTIGFITACDVFGSPCNGPVETEFVCPISARVFEDGTQCYKLVSREGSACPVGTFPETETTLCRDLVDLVSGPLQCAEGYEVVGGECLRFTAPLVTPRLDCGDACPDEGGVVVSGSSQDDPSGELRTILPTTLTFGGCSGGSATYSVAGDGGVVASGSLSEVSSGVYRSTYVVSDAGDYTVTVVRECPDGSSLTAFEIVAFIDPSGVITDCSGNPIAGAVVTLLRSDAADTAPVAVADGDASVMDPSVNVRNPSLSTAAGRYRWDVVPGFYQISASVEGQPTVTSAVLSVPPERTDVDLVFSELNCPVIAQNRPTFSSPTITNAPGQSPAPTPSVPATAVTTPATQPGLAVTGAESQSRTMLASALLGAGFAVVGIARVRRRSLDDR